MIDLLVAVYALVILAFVQSLIIAIMALTLPAFVWRCFKLEGRVDKHQRELEEADVQLEEINKLLLGLGPLPGSKP